MKTSEVALLLKVLDIGLIIAILCAFHGFFFMGFTNTIFLEHIHTLYLQIYHHIANDPVDYTLNKMVTSNTGFYNTQALQQETFLVF